MPELQTLKVFYVTSYLAYQKYTQHFYVLFPHGFVNNGDADLIDASFQFGWLIFVDARAKLFARGERSQPMTLVPRFLCIEISRKA